MPAPDPTPSPARTAFFNLVFLAGFGLLAWGLHLAWQPLAPIVCGSILLLAATRLGGKGSP